MKKALGVVLLSLLASTARADITYMVGISFTLTGEMGVTAKLLTNDKEEEFVAAGGVTYYPFSTSIFGADVSAGYVFENGTITGGWDFLQQIPQVSFGLADTEED